MKINTIELFNIGSFQGKNKIDVSNIEKNIILVGGKNGAGKTTLFESIKICIYGHKEAGYQTISSAYKKNIKSLINDYAKLEAKTKAFVSVSLDLFNGQEVDSYILKREWDLSKDDFEIFHIWKNGTLLGNDEVEIFNSYLLDLIPPELFNLYFFDGEQIADSFLAESGNEKIKEAFLVLCGYDTFDIMLQNFKRISYNKKASDNSSSIYLKSKERLEILRDKQKRIHSKLDNTYKSLEEITLNIEALKTNYRKNGGVFLTEWNEKLEEIKRLELYRESLNNDLKKYANDVIPFLIVKDKLVKVLEQIEKEENFTRQKILLEEFSRLFPSISENIIKSFDTNNKDDLIKLASELNKSILQEIKIDSIEPILLLSYSERQSLTNTLLSVLHYDRDIIIENRRNHKNSIKKTKQLREELDNCNINDIQDYMQKIDEYNNRKKILLDSLQDALKKRSEIDEEVLMQEQQFKHDTKVFEDELKNNSVVDLSAKSILFLEDLQNQLFEKQIRNVENLFIAKLNELIRKEHFLDKVIIDNDFNIHVYKRIILKCKTICKKIDTIGIENYKNETGIHHCQNILAITKLNTLEEFYAKYRNSEDVFDVMHEFEKNRMSKGEKQIFVMALYWALMTLSDKEVPFIIDTPFARIDKEHREKITSNFFNILPGQVFIFSTDEEIVGKHQKILKEKIGKTFLLENNNNKQSIIIENAYFEAGTK